MNEVEKKEFRKLINAVRNSAYSRGGVDWSALRLAERAEKLLEEAPLSARMIGLTKKVEGGFCGPSEAIENLKKGMKG